ncbi:16S rRNA (guanine(527)-N(7))-methyltransferase RsmG [Gordonia sinesedis]
MSSPGDRHRSEALRDAVGEARGSVDGSGEARRTALSPPPAEATVVFGDGDGVTAAARYAEILATDGIDHGLIGPREVPRLWARHLLNCAVIGERIPDGASVIDIGSGAGLPGIPLAIARPDLRLTLIEPLLRRSEFLERVVSELGLSSVRVVRGRAEERAVRAEVPAADIVTSRAVAPLERLAAWSAPLIAPDGRLVAIKGSSAADEICRDAAAVERLGITDLHTELCGEGRIPDPTTVVIGRKTTTPGSAASRRSARRGSRGKAGS